MSNISLTQEFRGEWLDDIPTDWKQSKIKHLFSIKKEIAGELGHDVISITQRGAKLKDTESGEGQLSLDYSKYQLVSEGDFLMNHMDLLTGYVDISKFNGVTSPDYRVFTVSNDNVYSKYFLYLFQHGYKSKIFYAYGRGSSQLGRWRFPTVEFEDFYFPFPPIEEQKLISRYLDKKTSQIDSLVEKIQKKVELLKEQRTSLINHYVTKGLDPNVEMKDSGVEWIGEIPKHWNRVRVKHLVSIKVTDGPHETPEFVDKGIPFLSVEGVVGNKIDLDRVRGYITHELHNQYSKKCKPVRDDVLLVKSGSTTGKSTIVDFDIEFNIWSPLCILRSNKSKVNPIFLFNSVQSRYFVTQVETNWSYGTQPNIGMGVIEELWIVLPPLYEQSDINNYLKTRTQELDHLISTHNRKINLYQEYRQSLISSVVTGKVRVTEDMI